MDLAWIQTLDQLFTSSAYEVQNKDPRFIGPDTLPYMAFHLAREHGVELINFQNAMELAIHWALGAAVYPGAGIDEWVYTAGDLVSLATTGTSAYVWLGDWGLDPIVEDYRIGTPISIGRPNAEFMPPLAARSLEHVMRKVFQAEEKLKDRVPGIAVTRPESRERKEQASEIMLNAYKSDFALENDWEGFQSLVRHFLPSYLGRRLLSFEQEVIPLDRFFAVRELVEEGGLQPVPESPR